MAFRKKTFCANLIQGEEISGLSEFLYIHQDLQEVVEEESEVNSVHGTDSVKGDPTESFCALPFADT